MFYMDDVVQSRSNRRFVIVDEDEPTLDGREVYLIHPEDDPINVFPALGEDLIMVL